MAKMNEKVEDVFEYLTDDHRIVSGLFMDLENTEETELKTRDEVFSELDSGLSLHVELEEATLYPALEKKDETADTIEHSIEEHDEVKSMLEDLRMMDKATPEWMEKLLELKKNVEHHVEEEEEPGGLFETAKGVLSGEEQEDLRKEMEDFLAE